MKQRVITMLVGMVLGMVLLSGGYAAGTALTATFSTQPIYVDGVQVHMMVYQIGGNNYVKLRDVGERVGFNVYWDGVAVQIESDKPYTGEGPVRQPVQPAPVQPTPVPVPSAPVSNSSYTIATDHWSREDFSQQANPAVFTGVYDRALYNTIRQTLVDDGPGNAPAYCMVAKGDDYSAVRKLLGRMDNTRWLEHYVPKNFTNYYEYLDYFAVSINVPEQFQAARDFVQPVIARANQLSSDREKVEYLHDYLCSLMAYDVNSTAGIASIFSSHSGELKGACGSYARAFNFLCSEANISSFTVSSSTHSWNMVYADGHWLYVDASADDLRHSKSALLVETYPRHTDIAPEATAFLKELLVPGSTK